MSIESSLLHTREDGRQDFVHDSYRDFFLAKAIYGRLKIGELTLSGLCELYIPKPTKGERYKITHSVIGAFNLLVQMLDQNKVNELVSILRTSSEDGKWGGMPFQDRSTEFIIRSNINALLYSILYHVGGLIDKDLGRLYKRFMDQAGGLTDEDMEKLYQRFH